MFWWLALQREKLLDRYEPQRAGRTSAETCHVAVAVAEIALAGAPRGAHWLQRNGVLAHTLLHRAPKLPQGAVALDAFRRQFDHAIRTGANAVATASTIIIHDQYAAIIPTQGVFGARFDAFCANATLAARINDIKLA